jgi:hypothetical protein
MLAYKAELEKRAAAQSPPSQPQSLRQKILTWHQTLPAVSRERPFAMSEFEAALKTQGKYIGPVLLDLGWRRRRLYETRGPYSRYWVPPARSDWR